MPSPGGILSQSGNRARSKTRQRKSKSHVSIRIATTTPRGALSSEGFGGKITDLGDPPNRQAPVGGHPGPKKSDSTWFLQTGMALTEGSRESKGQSWLAKRASSTSLHSPAVEDYPDLEYAQARCGRDTPTRSRRGSRDRRKNKRELAMTPAAVGPSSVGEETTSIDPRESCTTSAATRDYASVEPDWADSQTQAEIAADLEMDLADELEDCALYSDDGDRYDGLDLEGQVIEDEEREIEKAVRGRGFMLGSWVDSVVDAFLKMDETDEDEVEIKYDRSDRETVKTPEYESKENARTGQSRQEVEDMAPDDDDDDMESAPKNPKSIWEDLAWFGRLVMRTAKS